MKRIEIRVGGDQVRGCGGGSGRDPQVIVAKRATVGAHPEVQFGETLQDFSRLDVDDYELAEELLQRLSFGGSPIPMPRQGKALADRND